MSTVVWAANETQTTARPLTSHIARPMRTVAAATRA